MKASTMKWLMEVLRKGVYVEVGVAAIGFLSAITSAMIKSLPSRGFLFLFGILTGVFGIIFCYLSGVIYDSLNAKLRAAEFAERKEQQKQEKLDRKQKSKSAVEVMK